MSISRKMQRRQLKEQIARVPGDVVRNIEEIQDLNNALHAFNKVLLAQYWATRRFLAATGDEMLKARIEMSEAVDRVPAAHAKLMGKALPAILLVVFLAAPGCADQYAVVRIPQKTPFAVRHPVIHRRMRKFRKIGVPILRISLQVAAEACQVITGVKAL